MFLLIRKFIAGGGDPTDPKNRRKFGSLSGIAGIFFNLLLFAGKLTAALLSGSVSVIADAFNNLSDAASSVVTLVGFRLSGKRADPQHPFGHGRIEYISGFIVSVAILFMGYELAKSSIQGILSPKTVSFSLITAGVLGASILVKVYMALYNRKLAGLFDSPTLKAVVLDSLSDVAATGTVLLCLIISHYTALSLDSYAGLLVSGFILYSGVSAAKDTLAPLLGTPPSKELVKRIEDIVLAHSEIRGMHDLVVHDYGSGRLMISLHAEVPANVGIFESHSLIDDIEQELEETLGCEAVIHFDPVDTDDNELKRLQKIVEGVIAQIDPALHIHDFRYVPGASHTNLIFDLVVPYSEEDCDEALKKQISQGVQALLPNHNCVIKCDLSYL